MVSTAILRALGYLCVFFGTTVSRPSTDYGSFDDVSILPLGGMLHARSEPIEIRGVYGGRKKRYIIEREEPSKACKIKCSGLVDTVQKAKCFPPKYWNKKKCKCEDCPLGRKVCNDDCPKGEKEDEKSGKCVEDKDQCKLGQKKDPSDPKGEKCVDDPDECVKGQKMDTITKKCVPDDGCKQGEKKVGEKCEIDSKDTKGKCPSGQRISPAHGWDPDPAQMKCEIDDTEKCKPPKMPATRDPGDYLNKDLIVRCGDPDPKDKDEKCDKKTQYANIFVPETSGKEPAKFVKTCKKTRKYDDRKRTKPTDKSFRQKMKEKYEKVKDKLKKDRELVDKNKKLVDERVKKEDENNKGKNAKLEDENDRRKKRISQCLSLISLLDGAIFSESHKKSKRDGEEDPYDRTTDYFDEPFIAHADRLKSWPADIDINTISEDVDSDAFLRAWDDYIDEHKIQHFNCNFSKRDELGRRCSARRSVDEWLGDFNLNAAQSGNTSSLIQRDVVTAHQPESSSSTDLIELDRRQLQLLAPLFEVLFQFGLRVAQQLLTRAVATVAGRSPRLAEIIEKNGQRLMQIAKESKGTPKGANGMKNAEEKIRENVARWKECLKNGKPKR